MATPKQTDPQFKLRLTSELKGLIEESAQANNRSMNAEIVSRLERSFEPKVSEYDAEEVVNAVRNVVTWKFLSDSIPRNVQLAFFEFMDDQQISNRDIALSKLVVDHLVEKGYLSAEEITARR
ncbi:MULTISPECIES: Arc family DNA-binding protein [unclassified Phyllobacterium]|uniref:Arc family DNA-binding protein n=1 Tax=unclassified Phyllobacterium TaxID=2638441 RepID=UPI000B879D54|nr:MULTISPECIES: Arc family DNA-binding protein [unclassified Phyllobacterium]